jgi:hypothetical protein
LLAAVQESVAQRGVDRTVAVPDAEVGVGEVRAVDDAEPLVVQRQLRADAGDVGERVAVAGLDVAVPGIEAIEARAGR